MTETYGPFATGAGANFTESQWSSLIGAGPDGVIDHVSSTIALNKLEPFGDSSVLGVGVRTGFGRVRGHWYSNDAIKYVTLDAAHATLGRLDWIVLELDRTNKTVLLNKVTGVASASPALPALVRSASTWQIPIAYATVDAAVSIIAANKVTDTRLWAKSVYTTSLLGTGSPATTVAGPNDMPADGAGTTFMTITRYTDGGLVYVGFDGIFAHSALGGAARVYVQVDGGSDVQRGEYTAGIANATGMITFRYPAGALTAGMHTFKIRWGTPSGATASVGSRAMTVEEQR